MYYTCWNKWSCFSSEVRAVHHRMTPQSASLPLPPPSLPSLCPCLRPKVVQNRSVSSPAPVTIVLPSGLIAKYNTRYVWPVRLTTWVMEGYFQTTIWFWLYPWVETISLEFLDHAMLQTWLPVSISLMTLPRTVSWNMILLSAVPPPEASRPRWCGDQAIALTAAVWSENFQRGVSESLSQTISLLSFPPLANWPSSQFHLRPQTSCLWPISFRIHWSGARTSRW